MEQTFRTFTIDGNSKRSRPHIYGIFKIESNNPIDSIALALQSDFLRYLFIIFLINSSGFSELADGVYIEANKALIAENYYDAISKYESILNDGYESAELYYNLGNAYYRSEQLGKSIWAYSNALDIAPRNRDVAHNLSIANAQIVDRIEMPKSFVFITFYRLLKSIMTTYE